LQGDSPQELLRKSKMDAKYGEIFYAQEKKHLDDKSYRGKAEV
jgi:hypothetical protein